MRPGDASPLPASREGSIAGLLAEVTQEFAASLNVEDTLQDAIDQIIDYLQAEAASIFLLDEANRSLICRKCAGPVDITGLRLALGQGIVGATVHSNQLQLVRDVSQHTQFAASIDRDTGFSTRSILCVPLAVRGQCIGALELINKRGGDGLFGASDVHLATAVAAAAALAIHNARMTQVLVEQERMRKELELARAIQISLLPPADSTLPIHGLNLPAREVSGDFYDYVMLADGRIYFCIADVAGKGINAALLMAKTTSLLRCLAKTIRDPAELLAQVNVEVFETASLGMFVTIIAGFVAADRRSIQFANAGHHAPLQRLADGGYRELAATAPPLGVVAELCATTQSLALADGSIYLFTDGLTEARDGSGRALGLAGLKAVLETVNAVSSSTRLSAVVTVLEAQHRHFHDDITLVLVNGDER